jgi:hypothetical protein
MPLGPPALIGKEANKLEAVSVGLVETEAEVLNRYPHPKHSVWSDLVRPVLADMPPRLLREAVKLSPRALHALRRGRAQPRSDHALALAWAAVAFAQAQLTSWGVEVGLLPEALRAVSVSQARMPRRILTVLMTYNAERNSHRGRCLHCGAKLRAAGPRLRHCSASCRGRAWRSGYTIGNIQ